MRVLRISVPQESGAHGEAMNKCAMVLTSLLALAGCSGSFETSYSPVSASVSRGWTVQDVRVTVPPNLTTTENNSYAPSADIVWHGDPLGNRRVQVARIVDDGITRGASALSGSRPVTLSVTLQEFHAVTPRAVARAPAAVHNIRYAIQVLDARTGAPITQPEMIDADLQAFVGQEAVTAAQSGQTQKVRITAHIANVTRGWLGIGPDVRTNFRSLGR